MTQEDTSQLQLWSGQEGDTWTVRESRRARRLTVRVFHTGRVEIVVPQRTSRLAVHRFLERHRGWIEHKRLEARRRARPPEAFPPRQIDLGACGERWQVHLAGGAGPIRVLEGAPGLLSVSGDAGGLAGVRRALRQWLIERARQVLGALLEACARETRTSYARMIVRRQRTRWGSCSARGTISLNCCLLFQRPEVVRYLLVHELSHTRHMNHSGRFWQHVARYCPDYGPLDRELLDGWRRVPSWVFSDVEAT